MRARNQQRNINCIGLSGRILTLSLLLFAIGLGSGRANTVLWSEGFEGYNTQSGQTWGGLDKEEVPLGPNTAPNGSGNPWFGPNPAPHNGVVTMVMTNPAPTNVVVTPHSGQFMMRGSRNDTSGWFSGFDNDIDHVNIAYRFHGGAPLKANFMVDWWFYDVLGSFYYGDLDLGPGCFGDHAGLEYSTVAPTDTDYVNNGFIGTPGENPFGLTGDEYQVTARLAIGAYEVGTGVYDEHVYQVQVQGASDGEWGSASDEWGTGWFNTIVTRTNGWHHAAITVDGNNLAVLSIDDTVVLTHATGATNGFNVFTTTEIQQTPDNFNQSAYYDDITLSLITGPKIVGTSVSSATNLVINATDGLVGWTYVVLMSTNVTQALSQWQPISTNLLSATGPFAVVATNAVSAASSKRFFALQGAIQQ
jgi:hypothetical protein